MRGRLVRPVVALCIGIAIGALAVAAVTTAAASEPVYKIAIQSPTGGTLVMECTVPSTVMSTTPR